MRYQVYGVYTTAVLIGEFEAETPEQAEQLAEESEQFEYDKTLCSQCSHEIGDPSFHRFDVHPKEPHDA